MAKPELLDLGADLRLVEWLTSNPVAEVYSLRVPVMILTYETTRTTRRGEVKPDASGMRRWPLVPEPR